MAGPSAAVELRRGHRVESRHRVAFAVADAGGALLHAEGDPGCPVFPRSAVKPLQALAMVESSAADRFGLGDAELALACASHAGEPMHVERVRAWLVRLDLTEEALACGAHPPLHGPSAERLAREGEKPGPAHNNCSGKHAGMLTLARHLGAPAKGYLAPDHAVQRRIAGAIADMTGLDTLSEPAVDGCGVPTWPMPLGAIAGAMARFGAPDSLPASRATACRRLGAAMKAHAGLVAGTGRPCTILLEAIPEVVVKTGAEGVYVAAWPARRLGLALKVQDGAGRAASVALLAILDALGALEGADREALAPIARPSLRNHAGRVVGALAPAPGWPALVPAGAGA